MALARIASRVLLPIALVLGLALSTTGPAAAAETEYERVLATARAQLGDPWVHYARGPEKFDCVGLAWFVFHENDLQSHIGGYRGVKSYYNWFRERGLAVGRSGTPELGDLIIWGRFEHIGIYIGDGKAISALNPKYGVKIHPVKGWLSMRVRAYLHTRLSD